MKKCFIVSLEIYKKLLNEIKAKENEQYMFFNGHIPIKWARDFEGICLITKKSLEDINNIFKHYNK